MTADIAAVSQVSSTWWSMVKTASEWSLRASAMQSWFSARKVIVLIAGRLGPYWYSPTPLSTNINHKLVSSFTITDHQTTQLTTVVVIDHHKLWLTRSYVQPQRAPILSPALLPVLRYSELPPCVTLSNNHNETNHWLVLITPMKKMLVYQQIIC